MTFYIVHVVLSGYKPRQTTVTISDRPPSMLERPLLILLSQQPSLSLLYCCSSFLSISQWSKHKQVSFSLKVCVFSLHDIELHQAKRKTSDKNNDPVQRRFCLETQQHMTAASSFRFFIFTPLMNKIKITTSFSFTSCECEDCLCMSMCSLTRTHRNSKLTIFRDNKHK